MNGLSIKFKERIGDQFLIEANAEDRIVLLNFIRSSIKCLQDGDGPDTMVPEEYLEDIYQTIFNQKNAQEPIRLEKGEFCDLTEVAADWIMMVFANEPPEDYKNYTVKKVTAEIINNMHEAAFG